jgi:hypothetical protein
MLAGNCDSSLSNGVEAYDARAGSAILVLMGYLLESLAEDFLL